MCSFHVCGLILQGCADARKQPLRRGKVPARERGLDRCSGRGISRDIGAAVCVPPACQGTAGDIGLTASSLLQRPLGNAGSMRQSCLVSCASQQ